MRNHLAHRSKAEEQAAAAQHVQQQRDAEELGAATLQQFKHEALCEWGCGYANDAVCAPVCHVGPGPVGEDPCLDGTLLRFWTAHNHAWWTPKLLNIKALTQVATALYVRA
jgi:hypothetical protein